MLYELKHYIKYNSEKLGFLKLRDNFFDRLRNRGFRKFSLSKFFAAMSYSFRNEYLSNNDNIYLTVAQETQAEMALTEVAETIFQENLHQETKQRKRSGLLSRQEHYSNR